MVEPKFGRAYIGLQKINTGDLRPSQIAKALDLANQGDVEGATQELLDSQPPTGPAKGAWIVDGGKQ